MSQTSLTTVNKMIDDAFLDAKTNTVDFQLLMNVLYLLARELHILERRFFIEFELPDEIPKAGGGFFEVKIRASTTKSKTSTTSDKEKAGKQQTAKDDQSKKAGKNLSSESSTSVGSKETDKGPEAFQQEKLLVYGGDENSSKTSLATKEQFDDLVKAVAELSKRYNQALSETPKESEPLTEFHKKASFTDPMAVLQLATRLEFIETTANAILNEILEIIKYPPEKSSETVKVTQEVKKGEKAKKEVIKDKEVKAEHDTEKSTFTLHFSVSKAGESERDVTAKKPAIGLRDYNIVSKPKILYVTRDELHAAMENLSESIDNNMLDAINESNHTASKATNSVASIESKIPTDSGRTRLFEGLEDSVSAFTTHFNNMTFYCDRKMAEFQEYLLSMEYEIYGLEAMMEIQPTDDDTKKDIDDLNALFNKLDKDLRNTTNAQKQLHDKEDWLQQNIDKLETCVMMLDRTKTSREEAEQKLDYKAGIKDINKLLQHTYFLAVKGDMEQCVRAAYDKFNSQEYVWQKMIDEAQRFTNKKAEQYQLEMLVADINLKLAQLNKTLDFMSTVLGEPRTQHKRKYRTDEGPCLSCGVDLHEQISQILSADGDHLSKVPSPPKLKTSNASEQRVTYEGKCYPGFPTTHTEYPRAPVCLQNCDDLLTFGTQTTSRLPTNIAHKIFLDPNQKITEIEVVEKPCMPCNKRATKPPLRQPSGRSILRPGSIHRDSVITTDNKKYLSGVVINIDASFSQKD